MRVFILALSVLLSSVSFASVEVWDVKMVLQVPVVLDNAQSLGKRVYRSQTIRGYIRVEEKAGQEPVVIFHCLENKNHKVGGRNVTYDVYVDDVKWHGIGSNRTGKFNIRSVSLRIEAEPSYSVGETVNEDNSLLITMSGKGNGKYIKGFVAGQIGCGCSDYGHVSPTRIWNTCTVVDTAAVFGKFRMTLCK